MSIEIEFDCVTESTADIPPPEQALSWIKAVTDTLQVSDLLIHLRIVDEIESQTLNRTYRQKDYATNVLAFPADEDEAPYRGDLVICAPVVKQQALAQHKTNQAHWAHLIIHGCLHLSGYDHVHPDEAQMMEALEIRILNTVGFDNPYLLKG